MALLYVRMVAWSMGLQITVRGEGFEKRALIVANHISWTDIVAIAASVPTSFVARADVRHWPGMGQLAKLGATIFVDRASRRSTPSQVSAISSALRSGRVVLFPEGTTGNGSGLLPFRSTLFDGASGAPVQPVAIRYCERNGNQWDSNQLAAFAWDGDKTFLPHLGAVIASGGAKAELIVLPPLPPGRGDRKKRANEAHALIKAALRYAS